MEVNKETILLLTTNFPYPPGEQFLEAEILYLSKFSEKEIIILPTIKNGLPRPTPANLKVDNFIADKFNNFKLRKYFYLIPPLFNKILYKEIIYIIKKHGFNLKCLIPALITTAQVLNYKSVLKSFIKQKKIKNPVIYSYWFDFKAYAAILLKKEGYTKFILTRAHGFDLYEYRRKYNYMPLRYQFIFNIDNICPISVDGERYLRSTYSITTTPKINVSRIGINLPNKLSVSNGPNKLHVVSVSFCVPVKCIFKIIDAIAKLADERRDIELTWSHIGDGPLYDALKEQAKDRFKNYSNVNWKFLGRMKNSEVNSFYINEPVDVFINTSESEGIPVSIMEAMAHGVPSIAPNVGGIAEIIDNSSGILLSEKAPIQEIVDALKKVDFLKNPETRLKARSHIQDNFNAETNFKSFINELNLS